MFSYYGSKSKIVHLYPTPKFDKIIEPFAGSARYSLRFWEKDILLVDKFDVIVNIWNWLKQCNKNDILSLPILKQGQKLSDYNLNKEAKDLIYYCSTGGGGSRTGDKITCSENDNFNSWAKDKIRIAENLYKIKHWNIKLADYNDLENETATWFIDPPYMFGGYKYKFSSNKLDFESLGNWCKSRNGQIIVCENTKANWLPFKPMVKMQGIKFKTTEAIYSNYPTEFDYQMQSLF